MTAPVEPKDVCVHCGWLRSHHSPGHAWCPLSDVPGQTFAPTPTNDKAGAA